MNNTPPVKYGNFQLEGKDVRGAMENNLNNLKVAILIAHGFEHSEMVEPRKALEQVNAQTFIVSPVKGKVKSWKAKQWGDEFDVEIALLDADPSDFDALLLPGGVMNPDTLRMNPEAVAFVKGFIEQMKPIAAICHGPWLLIDAQGVAGKTLTSWPSLKLDLINAGAHWVDQPAVKSQNLVTSRKPEDIPLFNQAFIELLSGTLAARPH